MARNHVAPVPEARDRDPCPGAQAVEPDQPPVRHDERRALGDLHHDAHHPHVPLCRGDRLHRPDQRQIAGEAAGREPLRPRRSLGDQHLADLEGRGRGRAENRVDLGPGRVQQPQPVDMDAAEPRDRADCRPTRPGGEHAFESVSCAAPSSPACPRDRRMRRSSKSSDRALAAPSASACAERLNAWASMSLASTASRLMRAPSRRARRPMPARAGCHDTARSKHGYGIAGAAIRLAAADLGMVARQDLVAI